MSTNTLNLSHINSTIVRFYTQSSLAATQSYFKLLSRLRPELARRQAERLFTTPPRPAHTRSVPVAARRETILTDVGHLAVWQAGPVDAPAVLLVHGWGGIGAQLGHFVPPLLAKGFRVVWFDHPGHGHSEGQEVALPDFVKSMTALEATCGPFHSAIGHSLGGAAVGLALRSGLTMQRIVLIGTPVSMAEHIQGFARHLGITAKVRDALRHGIEKRYGRRIAEIDRIEELGTLRIPALLVHDADDQYVPFAHSLRLAAQLQQGHLIRSHGLGHFRILRTPSVIATVTRFVAGEAISLPSELPELPLPAPLY